MNCLNSRCSPWASSAKITLANPNAAAASATFVSSNPLSPEALPTSPAWTNEPMGYCVWRIPQAVVAQSPAMLAIRHGTID